MRRSVDEAPASAPANAPAEAGVAAPAAQGCPGATGPRGHGRRRSYRPPRLVAHGELASLIRLQPVAGTDDPGGFGTLPGS